MPVCGAHGCTPYLATPYMHAWRVLLSLAAASAAALVLAAGDDVIVTIATDSAVHRVRDTFLSTTIDVSLLFHDEHCDLTSPRLVSAGTTVDRGLPPLLSDLLLLHGTVVRGVTACHAVPCTTFPRSLLCRPRFGFVAAACTVNTTAALPVCALYPRRTRYPLNHRARCCHAAGFRSTHVSNASVVVVVVFG